VYPPIHLRHLVGAKASYDWKVGHVTVIPQVSAAWQHEFGDPAYSIVASLASGAGSSFTVTGPEIGRDSLLVGAGATVILSERVSAYLYYDGEFERTNYLSNNATAGVRSPNNILSRSILGVAMQYGRMRIQR
jgi:outer membrane autotransporter protein